MLLKYCVFSEFGRLKAVLLCRPHAVINNLNNPKSVLHERKIDYAVMVKEYEQIIKVYKKFNISVFFINIPAQYEGHKMALYNIMFTRDLFFMTQRGAIISKMASRVRSGEPCYVRNTLQNLGIPIRGIIAGKAVFEAADALWVNNKLVMVALGNRTNMEGFRQLKELLSSDSIECVGLPAPAGVLHLLGALQFVDSGLALVRKELIGGEINNFLKKNKIKIIPIPENSEIRENHAMNFVAISPKKIIMPKGCPRIRSLCQRQGIKIAAEVDISQLINAGGGLACASGILARGI